MSFPRLIGPAPGVGTGAQAPAVEQVAELRPAPHLACGIQRGPVFGEELRVPAERQPLQDPGRVVRGGLVELKNIFPMGGHRTGEPTGLRHDHRTAGATGTTHRTP